MKKILVVGGASYDLSIYVDKLPDGNPGSIFSTKSIQNIGGTGAGKSLNFEKLGFETFFHSFIGDDKEGQIIRDYFNTTKIKFLAEKDEKSTLRFTNIIDKDGKRISIFTAYNTFEPVYDRKHLKQIIKECDYLVLNIMNYARFLIEDAKIYNKEIWCDIHDYDGKNEYHQDFIDGSDYIFMSSEGVDDYKNLMKKFIDEGKKLVVCTHGKNGASVLTASGEYIEEPIIDSYEKMDVNGAGDSFFAGFLYAFSKEYDVKKCMRFGTINGGLCITSPDLMFGDLSPEYIENEYLKHYNNK